MSLNHREIDHILEEMDLEGAYVQGIYQPTLSQIVLHFFKNRPQSLLLSFDGANTRLHQTWKKHPNTLKLQRFPQLLRSRLMGSQLTRCKQIDHNRLVLFEFTTKEGSPLRLWARLWSNQGNLILTDPQNKIIDCLYRKPAKGEVSGGVWIPPTPKEMEKPYLLRFDETSDYNRQIEDFYWEKKQETQKDLLENTWDETLKKRLALNHQTIDHLMKEISQEKAQRFQHWGNLLLSYPALWGTQESLFIEGETIPREGCDSASELSALYFKRYKKLKETARHATQRKEELERENAQLQQALAYLLAPDFSVETFKERFSSLLSMPAHGKKNSSREKENTTGLTFTSQDFTLLVGRNAKENDLLLRKGVKSLDLWLHLRDFPGSYVFIKHKKDKTIPLEVLLDAGNLALFYSQKRKLLRADLYYTQVKYLKRPKGAKLGLVIPTQEKNLSITLDEVRLSRLLKQREDS